MNIPAVFGLFFFICVSSSYALKNCKKKYGEGHTACLKDKNLPGEQKKLLKKHKKEIVDVHNEFRAAEQAADMQKMYWDDELARTARKWAAKCKWGHDQFPDRSFEGRYLVGQNLMYNTQDPMNWTKTIGVWQAEKSNFKRGVGSINGNVVGHYTQLVWAKTARIGCGYAECPENTLRYMYVCNYGPAGNFAETEDDDITKPFKKGKAGRSCGEEFYKEGLCDCNGLACHLGGTLNLKTCKCKCPKLKYIENDESGQCVVNCAKAKDRASCGEKWPKSKCKTHPHIADRCPNMCGVCP